MAHYMDITICFLKYHNFTILCHVDFTIVSEQSSQTNFPIIKTNPFKVTNIKYGGYLDQSGRRKKSVIILSLLLKIITNITLQLHIIYK